MKPLESAGNRICHSPTVPCIITLMPIGRRLPSCTTRGRCLRLLLMAAALFAASGCATAPPEPVVPEPVPPVSEPIPPPPPAAQVTVAGSRVNVREGPAKGRKVVGSLKRGEKAGRLSEKPGWTEVRLPDGKTGWVASSYLAGHSQPAATHGRCTEPDKLTAELVDEPILAFSDAGPHGDVEMDIQVDAAGIPKSSKVVRNTTGSPELSAKAQKEALELRFVPPLRRCKASAFIYTFTRRF